MENNTIALKLLAATRWGSEAVSLENVLINKQYLKQVAISNKAINLLSKESIKHILLDNTIFWIHVETVYNLLKPIANLITILESETYNVSTVVVVFNNNKYVLKNQIETSTLLKKEEYSLTQQLENRKHMAVKKMHLAGYLLNPRNNSEYFEDVQSVNAVVPVVYTI